MHGSQDFNTGLEDAQLAVKHLQSFNSDVDFDTVLMYIYKNFGTKRYRESVEAYRHGVQEALNGMAFGPGRTSESPVIQEGNIESAPSSYYN